MSADWIKMRCDLFTNPKVVRISSALKADTLRTVGGLMSVWCLFDAHSEDGSMIGYSCTTLDDHLRWPGFATAMMAVGWLSETDEGLDLPRFETHNGTSAKRRAQDADRKKEVRKTSASEADKLRTREEKRREENIYQEQEQDQKPVHASLREPAAKVAKGSRLNSDWKPSDAMLAYAASNRPDVNALAEAENFRDYWIAKAGAGGVKLDWEATWRTWIRRASASHARAAPLRPDGKPSAAADFRNTTYTGTPYDELPPELR